ncbi:hypothetical protein ABZY93_11450 [Streptomyces smyrnaeus]|uniref:hypothetical protein n=1 Tax=Streptomyces smyrnaeus TaxID=1387713 RepID=UPI0033A8F202
MSAHKAAATAVAALVAATLALTAGCGADGDKQRRAQEGDKSGRPGASAPPSPGKEPPPPKEGQERRPEDRATPKLPRDQLTPATGSFTKKEKKYLVGRVPEGLEPAAVLEAGRTACARLRTTAEVSRKDAISALRTGEIDNAGPAITHLCPTFKPLLKAAGKK